MVASLPSGRPPALDLNPQALRALPPAQRLAVLQAQISHANFAQLWQSLGGTPDTQSSDGTPLPGIPASPFDPMTLLALAFSPDSHTAPPPAEAPPALSKAVDPAPRLTDPNARYAPDIAAAAQRSGLPQSLLTAIIGAEAARINGQWDPKSQNPRSSAAGLTQFLDRTWLDEAERPGTYLNDHARAQGWLHPNGTVQSRAREALLDLRFEPRFAIEAAADFARNNLDHLQDAGVAIPANNPQRLAELAYLAHHLGPGDAAQFLTKGGLAPARAERLLTAQIGPTAAQNRIDSADSAPRAHANWLNNYVARKINIAQAG